MHIFIKKNGKIEVQFIKYTTLDSPNKFKHMYVMIITL